MMKSTTAKSQGASSAVPSHLSKMSESRRTRLEEIQKREQLKGMLITKFFKKYGQGNGELQTYIENQIQRFMNANRLTETNLRELDEKIQHEKETIEKKLAIRAQREAAKDNGDIVSQAPSYVSKRPSTAKPSSAHNKAKKDLGDLKSQNSRASRVSMTRS